MKKITWYSRLSALVLFLGIVPILTFYFGMKYQEVKHLSEQAEMLANFNSLTNSSVTKSADQNEPKKYLDEKYGWSFEYPAKWNLKTVDGVVIVSSDIFSKNGINDQAPVAEVRINSLKKSEFQPIGTKVGDISYNSKVDAIVDTLDGELRCLPVDNFIGTDKIPTFLYSASNMSDPAYDVLAILSDKDYMLVKNNIFYDDIHSEENKSVQEGLKMIKDTFKLSAEDKAITPSCVQN